MREHVGGCLLQPGEELAARLQWTPQGLTRAACQPVAGVYSTRKRAMYGK
jgi:hypothetical protein